MLAHDRERAIFSWVATLSSVRDLRNLALVSRHVSTAVHAELFRSVRIPVLGPDQNPFLAALLNKEGGWPHAHHARSISFYGMNTDLSRNQPPYNSPQNIIAVVIRALPNLRDIQQHEPLSSWASGRPSDVTAVFKALAQLDRLRSLNLFGNLYGTPLSMSAELLRRIGTRLQHFEILVDTHPLMWKPILDGARHSLFSLKIRAFENHPTDYLALTELLQDATLSRLSFLTVSGSSKFTVILQSFILRHPTLEEINCDSPLSGLSTLTSLRSLNLQSDFTPSYLAKLLVSLPNPERLSRLRVSLADIRSQGDALGKALLRCTGIEELFLEGSEEDTDEYDWADVTINDDNQSGDDGDKLEDGSDDEGGDGNDDSHPTSQALPDLIPPHPTLRYLNIEALPFPLATLPTTPHQFSYDSVIESRSIDDDEEGDEDEVYSQKVLAEYERRNLRWARSIRSTFRQAATRYAEQTPSLERIHWAPWSLLTEDGPRYHVDVWITRENGNVSVKGGLGRKLEGMEYVNMKNHEAFGDFKGPYDIDL